MSLGTSALKVGWGPKHLKHSKEISMATLQAGTTAACSRQLARWYWRNSVENTTWPHTYQHTNPKKREGRAGNQNLQRFALARDLQRSNENASMGCNVSHRMNKGPCGHPTDHVLLRRRLLTALARNLTLHKLHSATFTMYLHKNWFNSGQQIK